MPVLPYSPSPASAFGTDAGVLLQSAQTGNADSTNIADRGLLQGGGGVLIVSTIGGAPTVSVNLLGSLDGASFFNVPYALVATPRTFVITAITITTAVTTLYILQELIPWRFFKINMSANNNVTLTSTFWSR
jgi:hypothetical protein